MQNVPAEAGQIFVSQTDRHLLAFGATPYDATVQAEDTGTFDPLLIRFSNQDEPENFRPELTNSAGFLKVSSGTRIVAAAKTRQEILVFTDASVHSFTIFRNVRSIWSTRTGIQCVYSWAKKCYISK